MLNYLYKVSTVRPSDCTLVDHYVTSSDTANPSSAQQFRLNNILQKSHTDIRSSVTENGFAVKDENMMTIEDALRDEPRVHYYAGVTSSLFSAVHEDGVDVRGYFGWSEYPDKIYVLALSHDADGLGIF